MQLSYNACIDFQCKISRCVFSFNGTIALGILYLDLSYPTMLQWCLYATLLSFFHFMEFFVTAFKQKLENVKYESFVINHSKSYTVAAIVSLFFRELFHVMFNLNVYVDQASWLEYWIESYFFGELKHNSTICLFGVAMVLSGQFLRSSAMWNCGEHFAHNIMVEKDENHKLVTTGIYKWLRHPSYAGWFYWSIGTQLILCNPVCACGYTYASWSFFHARIPYEEALLLKFYKSQYKKYMESTIVGIPFIHTVIVRPGSARFHSKLSQEE